MKDISITPHTLIEEAFRLTPDQKKGLYKLRLKTLRDLIYYFPSRYESTAEITNISELHEKMKAEVFGRIEKLETSKAFRKKIPMAKGVIQDETGVN